MPVSFLKKTWKKKDSKTTKSADDGLQTHSSGCGKRQTEGQEPSSSSFGALPMVSAVQAPILTLAVNTPSKETFSSSMEEAWQKHSRRGGQPAADDFSNRDLPSSDKGGFRSPFIPAHLNLQGPPANVTHGPPRNAKHGPSNILQVYFSSVNCLLIDLKLPTSDRSSVARGQLPLQYRSLDNATIKARSPTRVKFDTPVDIAHTPLPSLSTIPTKTVGSSNSSRQLKNDGVLSANAESSSRPSSAQGLSPASHRREVKMNAASAINRTSPRAVNAPLELFDPPKVLDLYPSTSSAPDVPSPEAPGQPLNAYHNNFVGYSTPENNSDFPLALFPSPPPLRVRKKVPRPLVLQPSASAVPFHPPPSPSSIDSSPISTPTSSRYLSFATTPSQTSPPAKPTLGRKGGFVIPPRHEPPTSPLPSTPISPPPVASTTRTSASSYQGQSHLRGVRSVSNLRCDATLHPPTHRITSSEPTVDAVQETMSQRRTRDQQALPDGATDHSTQEPPIQWGYAF